MVYYPQTPEELKNIMDGYDAISFDIWDTLIARKVLYPEDVFQIVEDKAGQQGIVLENFSSVRHDAVFHVKYPNPNLTEIYDALQEHTGITDEEKKILMQLEIQTEKEVVLPRRDMAELFFYALKSGKKVTLITDMYLPETVMKELLETAGITEYGELFVSCEYRQLKQEQLFSIYKEAVPAKNYLHIGDNPNSDIAAAEQNGMDAVKIKKGLELLKESVFGKLPDMAEGWNEKCMTGLFCAGMFNSPFITPDEQGRYIIESPEKEGALFIAPLVSKFMVWLSEELGKDSYDGVLFSARDGYLLQKLYKIMNERMNKKLPPGRYFLSSRQLTVFTGIKEDKDIIWLSLVKFNGSKEELLRYRFCLSEDEILPEQEILSKQQIISGEETSEEEMTGEKNLTATDYVLCHKDRIYDRVRELRGNYLEYMRELGLKEGGKYVFFDFVSSGTCQYYLNRIAPYELVGKYFCRSVNDDEKKSLNIDSLYVNDGVEKADSYLYQTYRYLETIMTAMTPSVHYVDEALNAVYDEETRTREQLDFVEAIHRSVEEYFVDFMGMYQSDEPLSRDFAEEIYQFMDKKYVRITCQSLDEMELRDDWVRETAVK